MNCLPLPNSPRPRISRKSESGAISRRGCSFGRGSRCSFLESQRFRRLKCYSRFLETLIIRDSRALFVRSLLAKRVDRSQKPGRISKEQEGISKLFSWPLSQGTSLEHFCLFAEPSIISPLFFCYDSRSHPYPAFRVRFNHWTTSWTGRRKLVYLYSQCCRHSFLCRFRPRRVSHFSSPSMSWKTSYRKA